jgi:hypothetical protein
MLCLVSFDKDVCLNRQFHFASASSTIGVRNPPTVSIARGGESYGVIS